MLMHKPEDLIRVPRQVRREFQTNGQIDFGVIEVGNIQ